jgi:predicted small metal-binding protein
MKTVACKDVNPGTTCDFEASGSNNKEAVNKLMDHMRSAHANDMKGMNDGDIRKKIEGSVKDA